jgi:iron complex transport system ATP-binding protein
MNCAVEGLDLEARGVGFSPPRGPKLIADISLRISAGERLAIVGPNGAGKTTLLRCLFRGARPSEGSVLLGGEDIWSIPQRDFARKVAVVLQESPAAFPFSVRDIVMMGRIPWRRGMSRWSEEDRAKVHHALEHLGLENLAERQFSTLSGGEKQRVLVARALAQEPRLLILDEPSNHLDIRHQLDILHLLEGLGVTVIATLHDINLAAGFASRAAILNGGRLTAFGPPETVLTETAISGAFGVEAAKFRISAEGAARFAFSRSSYSGAFL